MAKLIVNTASLAALQCILVPLFLVLSGVPLLERPWPIVLVGLLGSLGIASVGTLIGAPSSAATKGAVC